MKNRIFIPVLITSALIAFGLATGCSSGNETVTNLDYAVEQSPVEVSQHFDHAVEPIADEIPEYIIIGGKRISVSETELHLDTEAFHITDADIAQLRYMTNLQVLSIGCPDIYSDISDISVLAGLTNLKSFSAMGSNISDVSALAGLTNLTFLELEWNQISDISALSGLVNLTDLRIMGNQIEDISALAGLANLTNLFLHGDQISDISALAGLTNLIRLILSGDQINNISALSNLTNLTDLWLTGTPVTDLSPLSGLPASLTLVLMDNQISDWSPVAQIDNVRGRPWDWMD